MSDRGFFDTNIVVYTLAESEPRSATAEALLSRGGYISVQVLNELTAVGRRKFNMSWSDLTIALEAIRTLCHPAVGVSLATHEAALKIAGRYGYTIHDSLIVASALESKCAVLYSEDMQSGQEINESLTIRNPF